jgi:predicted dehydrogenase
MTAKVRYGLLGASQIARGQHIPAIRQASNAELVGIASRDPAKAAAWAMELNIPRAYASYDAMLADPEIDAVLITLPMSLHCQWIVAAARAGKHVLCEKPMVLSAAEMDAVIEAAAASGVIVLEGFTHVYPGHLAYVADLLASGRIGEVRAVRAEVLYPTRDWAKDTRALKEYGACVLIEAGCYCVQTILHLMQADPTDVCGFGVSRDGCDFETTFAGVMKFPGERVGYMCTTMESSFRAVCDIIGTRGRIDLPDLFDGTRVIIDETDGPREEVTFPQTNRFAQQIEHLGACVLEGCRPMVSLDESRRIIQTLAALRDSAAICRSQP